MTTITCKLPDGLAAQLDSVAREQRLSKSAILREALEQRLQGGRKPVVYAFDLVKHLCASIEAGPTDLATNPEHLDGFGQ
jgi:predicted transcriptional regulator